MWPINSRRHRVKAATIGKRVHFLEHLAHDAAGMEEHDRTFRSSLTQLGRRAISKARDVPALPAAPIRPTLLPSEKPVTPDRPDQTQAVLRAFVQTASVLASAARSMPTPGQPGPTRAAEAPLPTPAPQPSRAYPQADAGIEASGSQRPDPGQAASPGSGHSGLAQRLLRHLRLRP